MMGSQLMTGNRPVHGARVGTRQGGPSSIAAPLPAMWGARWMAVLIVMFALMPAILFEGSSLAIVVRLAAASVAAFAVGEYIAERRQTPSARLPCASPRFVRILIGVTLLCAASGYALAIAGGFGSVAEVAFGYQYSSLYSLSRMMTSATPFALALVVFAEYFGAVSRRTAFLLGFGLLGLAFMQSLGAGYLGGASRDIVVFMVLGTMTRLIRWRLLLAGLVIALATLPLLFGLRDDVRESAGLGRSSQAVGPLERFRVDTQISLLDWAWPSSWVEVPGLSLLVRTAFIPRVLDPDRPVLDIGKQMNFALGNLNQNNVSFGNYGTVFWLLGPLGVVVVAALLGGMFGLGVRNFDRVWGVALLATVATPAVWPEITFPDYFVGIVQSWQVYLALFVAALVLDRAIPPQKPRRNAWVASRPLRSAPSWSVSDQRVRGTTVQGSASVAPRGDRWPKRSPARRPWSAPREIEYPRHSTNVFGL